MQVAPFGDTEVCPEVHLHLLRPKNPFFATKRSILDNILRQHWAISMAMAI
jgi:hypothetical protein